MMQKKVIMSKEVYLIESVMSNSNKWATLVTKNKLPYPTFSLFVDSFFTMQSSLLT